MFLSQNCRVIILFNDSIRHNHDMFVRNNKNFTLMPADLMRGRREANIRIENRVNDYLVSSRKIRSQST